MVFDELIKTENSPPCSKPRLVSLLRILKFKQPKLTAAVIQQLRIVMDSNLLGFTFYKVNGGFLNKKFWVSDFFHGKSDTVGSNLRNVNMKIKMEYKTLDMLPTIQ